MNDLELHNLVRDSLQELKPAYNEKHWRHMQAKLIVAPVRFRWKMLLILLVPGAFAGFLWWHQHATSIPLASSALITPSQLATEDKSVPLYAPLISDAPKALPPTEDRKASTRALPMDEEAKTEVEDTRQLLPIIDYQGPMVLSADISLPSLRTYFVEEYIKSMLLERTIVGDSTTFNALERNKNKWSNAAVVCDWTTSMFPYGTQIFTWLDLNQHNDALMGYLFFNDCDVEGNPLGPEKLPGGMYHTTKKEPKEVLEVLITAIRHGASNSDLQENDLEALMFASNLYDSADEMILIADNISPVRYPALLKEINKPVRIIVCGSTMTEEAIQPIYLELARSTGGSIHTIEDDIEDLNNIPDGKWIRVGDVFYQYNERKQQFVASKRKKRPKKDY